MTAQAHRSQAQAVDKPAPDYSLVRSGIPYLVLAVAIGAAENFADPDLWLHLLAGRQMLDSGQILLRDSYSYAAARLPWYNHEWLAQVVFAAAYLGLGVAGLKLVKVVCTAVMMVALGAGLARSAAPPAVQRLTLIAAATALITQIQFRPSLFTLVMLSIVVARLAAEVYSGPVRLWPLIPLFALWANLHAGCFAGLGALGIFTLIFGVQELRRTHRLVRTWHIGAVSLLCACATLLNPQGAGLWTTFFASACDPLMRPIISDWAPLFRFLAYTARHSIGEPLQYAVPLLMFAAFPLSLLAAPVMDDLALSAIGLIFTAAAFYSNRNVGLAVIALAIPFARHIGIALRKPACRHAPELAGAGPNRVLVMAAAVLIAISGGEFSRRLKTWDAVPEGAVAFMRQHNLHGNVLGDFDWGEYLIWHLTPQSKVFIDGRYQLVYPQNLRKQYLAFLYGWPGGDKLLALYPHDFILVKPETAAYRIVAADAEWRELYRDSVSALFGKASMGRDDSVAGKPVAGRAADSFFP
jgi:hypothetical protein